jgi:hypothetical protein
LEGESGDFTGEIRAKGGDVDDEEFFTRHGRENDSMLNVGSWMLDVS